jgi:hypothetical protein
VRQVRFKDLTLSFHILDDQSLGIGQQLVYLIRRFKKQLEPELTTFTLPKLVRFAVWKENPQTLDASGTFGGVLPLLSLPYHISINAESLYEEELRFKKDGLFDLRLLQVFLHELAHFITLDEKETDKIAFEVLNKITLGLSFERAHASP